MRVEVEKARRARAIGEACGLFRVPRVLDYDDSRGKASFERLPGLRDVSNLIAFRSDCAGLLETIGKSLATIHQHLRLPAHMVKPLPSELRWACADQVFLHGDFNAWNVCVGRVREPIVILDWRMTAVHGERATYDTPYFDLAWFVNSLFSKPIHRYALAEPPAPRASRFLRSYFRLAQCERVTEGFREYMKRFLALMERRDRATLPWPRRVARIPYLARFRAFVDALRV